MARKKAKALPQPEPEMFTVYGDIVQETEDAILVTCEGEQYWLPKSQIEYEGERGDEYVAITLPDWLAEDKGLSDNQGFMPPQAAPLDAATDAVLAAAEQEPETVTLFGTFHEEDQDAEGIVFTVHYGDEDDTMTDFTIPRDAIMKMEKDGDYPEDDDRWFIELTVAYAVQAGIIEDPDGGEAEESPATGKGATPEILRKHPDLKWLAEEQITVTQTLTEAEKAEYADEMAKLDKEIEELEDERSRVSNSLKKQIDAKEQERRSMSTTVREGKEEREILCDKVADYDSGEIKWADAVTGEVVDKRPMTGEERQLPLPIESMGGKKVTAAAPDPGMDFDSLVEAAPEQDTPCETCRHWCADTENCDAPDGHCSTTPCWEPIANPEDSAADSTDTEAVDLSMDMPLGSAPEAQGAGAVQ